MKKANQVNRKNNKLDQDIVEELYKDITTPLTELFQTKTEQNSINKEENVLKLKHENATNSRKNNRPDNFGQAIKELAHAKNSDSTNDEKLPFGFTVRDLAIQKRKKITTPLEPENTTSELFPDYELVFSDEFNGDELNLDNWNTQYYYGSRTNIFNNEEQYYQDDAFEFNDGVLSIIGQQESIEAFESVDKYLLGQANQDLTFDYTSGMLSGHDKVAFTYGYMEIRAQVPQGQGLWAAFWMLPSSGEWPPEIDIMEILGDETDVAYQTVHYRDDAGEHNMSGSYYAGGIDFSADFHTFGAEWNADGITWYIDNVEVVTIEDNIPAESMYLLANLAIGGNWPGATTADTPDYSTFDIDYIRVYQNSEATLHGGSADDDLSRQNGNLSGEAGNDNLLVLGTGLLDGGDGNDILTGGTGNNSLNGGSGDDLLQDGSGIDTFTGGSESDRFILGTKKELGYSIAGNNDYALITDFDSTEDTLQLTGKSSQYLMSMIDSDNAIYFDNNRDGLLNTPDDLIAVIENNQALNFEQSYFEFV